MRLFIIACFCLACSICQAQTTHYKIGVKKSYIPKFTVQEASDTNIQPIALRGMIAHGSIPFEYGLHLHIGFGEVARFSYGANLAYFFAETQSHDFKLGVSLSKVDLKNIEVNKEEFGPHVGDVDFTSWGREFKPYIEWEWKFTHFSSLFVQTNYRIINGEKSVVTDVESADNPIGNNRKTERDESFFYSAAGFAIGAGVSIIF